MSTADWVVVVLQCCAIAASVYTLVMCVRAYLAVRDVDRLLDKWDEDP